MSDRLRPGLDFLLEEKRKEEKPIQQVGFQPHYRHTLEQIIETYKELNFLNAVLLSNASIFTEK